MATTLFWDDTNSSPSPSGPQRVTFKCTGTEFTFVLFRGSINSSVIVKRVPTGHRSSVIKYRPDTLMFRIVSAAIDPSLR